MSGYSNSQESFLATTALEVELYTQVQDLANKQGYSMPKMIRALVIQGLILRNERAKLEGFIEHHQCVDDLLADWFSVDGVHLRGHPTATELAAKYGTTERVVLEIVAKRHMNPHYLPFGVGAGPERRYLRRKVSVVT